MATDALSPRERLLATARRLFYTEGIHSVPVDRLVTEAGVTRATFYRHFPAKEDLVEAYLRATDADLRTAVAVALDQPSPQEAAAAPLRAWRSREGLSGRKGPAPGEEGQPSSWW